MFAQSVVLSEIGRLDTGNSTLTNKIVKEMICLIHRLLAFPTFLVLCCFVATSSEAQNLKALIVDGQNNHGSWPKTTVMMKDILEQTGLFTVDVKRTAFTWQGPHSDASNGEESLESLIPNYPIKGVGPTQMVDEPQPDPNFKPDFSRYDVIICNFGWTAAPWPEETQRALEEYMRNGGGLVIVHAANNSWGDWEEYNKMIAIGGWGDRTEKNGPFLYYDDKGELIRDESPGNAGSHGLGQEFVITIRDPSHPITKGLPKQWLHGKDELYDRLRGPAENVTVLATAYSDPEKNAPPWNDDSGTGHHEPMLLTIEYGKGRIFHTTLGHTDYSMESVGFIVTLQRGTEWAATGKVKQAIPKDFPTAEKSSHRPWTKK